MRIIERNNGKRFMQGFDSKGRKLPLAILTAENPDCRKTPAAENNFRNRKLESYLKEAGYLYKKIKGYYGVSEDGALTEHSFVILGIPLSVASRLSSKYEQQSFIYRPANGGYQMYAKDRHGEYVIVDEVSNMDFVSDYDDFYSASKDFKGSIPFTKFEVDDEVDDAVDEMDEQFESWNPRRKKLYLEGCGLAGDKDRTGRYRYGKRRTALYGDFED